MSQTRGTAGSHELEASSAQSPLLASALWRWLKKAWPGALALLVLALAAYWPLIHAGYIWDDYGYIVQNPSLRHVRGLWSIWFVPSTSIQYYPLVYTLFWIEYHLWGTNPVGFHLLNIVLQAMDGVLLWMVLRQVRLPGAWLAAALFTVHPVQVETVGWAVEQKNLTSAALAFGAVLMYLRAFPLAVGNSKIAVDDSRAAAKWGWWYAGATALYVAALLGKTDVCTLPALLLVLAWWRRGRIGWRDIAPTLLWFGFGLALAAMTIHVEHHQAGAKGPAFAFSLAQRTIMAGHAIWFYLGKLAWPHPLLEVYWRWNPAAMRGWQWLWPLSALGVIVILFILRGKIGRGPLTASLFFGIAASPVLGFISYYTMRYTFVADHYQYLACIGPLSLAAAGVVLAARRWGRYKLMGEPVLLWIVSAILLLALAAVSYAQSLVYEPPYRVWSHVLKYNPNCWVAQENLAVHYAMQKQLSIAGPLLASANKLSGGADPTVTGNIGDMYYLMGQYSLAIKWYRVSLAGQPHNMHIIKKLVHCYEHTGDWANAIKDIKQGLAFVPRSAALHFMLAADLVHAGNFKAAALAYRQGLRFEPHNTKAHYDLAITLERLGDWQGALRHFARAVAISPQYALCHYAYGRCLLAHGRAADAIGELQVATRLARKAITGLHFGATNHAPLDNLLACLQTLAKAYRADGELQRAKAAQDEAHALDVKIKLLARHGLGQSGGSGLLPAAQTTAGQGH